MVHALLAVALGTLSFQAFDQVSEGGDAPRHELKPLLQRADALYAARDVAGNLEALEKLLKEAEQAAPQDYEVLWRLARLYFWLSDDPSISDDEKSRIGKRGWELGERAVKADPKRVEGQYYAAVAMGNYALGLGVLKALRQGIEGKFKERLSRAEKLDPGYSDGAIPTAWGRFYFKLPWPKYDAEKSERHLLEALKKSPDNVRARLYLADLYVKEDHPREARAQLEKVVAHQPGSYDAPEERRTLKMARAMLARMK
jgi:cytochrome c-type biogenesis protein CcmH/NrfG